jgi:hypothetical protein
MRKETMIIVPARSQKSMTPEMPSIHQGSRAHQSDIHQGWSTPPHARYSDDRDDVIRTTA